MAVSAGLAGLGWRPSRLRAFRAGVSVMSVSTAQLQSREILVGVTGGIAAYKTADLVSKLVQSGAGVSVVLSAAAEHFIAPGTFTALTNRRVHGPQPALDCNYRGEHIVLAERAELYVIAPATAHCLARLAHGLADDLLTTLALCITCPLVIAPAMNCEMWAKPAVQRNVQQLRSDGAVIVGPGEGWLSCGRVGAGRMAEPVEILNAIASCLMTSGETL